MKKFQSLKNIGLNINIENTNKRIDLSPEKEFTFCEKEVTILNTAENPLKAASTQIIFK